LIYFFPFDLLGRIGSLPRESIGVDTGNLLLTVHQMDEIADSCGSKQRSLSVSPKDKGSKNKRKSADPSMGNALNIPPSLTEFPRYELSPEVSQRSLSELMLELGLDRLKEGPVPEAFGTTDWDDSIACQLEEILFSHLQVVFRCAIKQIAELGYSEEVAEKIVSRGGLYLEGKDPVVNIVNDTLYFMEEGKDIHVLRDDMFDDLQHLVEYTMLEIIGVLREVRPSLSIGEAMWWLLICDLNVSQACALERDPLSDLGCKDVSGEGSSDCAIPQFRSEVQSSETILPNPTEPKFPKLSLPKAKNSLPKTLNCESFPNLPKPEDLLSLEGVTPEEENLVSLTCTLKKSSGITRENVQIESQTYASEEKMGDGRKGQTKKELAALRQKCFLMEKSYYGSKGGFRSGKLASFGGFVLERRLKPPSELPGVQMKNASSKKSTEVPADVPLADGSHPVNKSPSAVPAKEKTSKLGIKGTISMLPTAETKLPISSPLEKKSNPKPQVSISEAPKIPDYYTGIPYENSLGKHVAQNEKDELILKLVPRLQELQDELQGWTDWANEKVMHAAHRLGKDQRELKALRLGKEEAGQYKKEKQILEENTMKRLSEMENALGNATGQVEILNSTALSLEVGKSVLKRELDAAKLRALESAASYQEVVEREQMTLKKAQSWEGQKVLLQEELEREKCKVAELQQELDKAKNLHNQIEVC
jgi:hypothetical protein